LTAGGWKGILRASNFPGIDHKEFTIRPRVVVLALFLAVSLAGIGLKIYWVWQEGPWDLPEPVSRKPVAASSRDQEEVKAAPSIAGTEVIVAKNLFDPERGASKTKETEADMRAAQRVRGLVLLGTAILGANRYAIVQDAESTGRPVAGAQPPAPRRMKLGDSVDGFSLAEVGEKRVVFAKGAMRVEVPVDYFRKVPVTASPTAPQPAQPRAPGAVAPGAVPGQIAPGVAPAQPAPAAVPRVVPNLPRRPRLPSSPESQP
jgi:hypothetical protein